MQRDYSPISNMTTTCSGTAGFTADANIDYIGTDEMDGCYGFLGTTYYGYEDAQYSFGGDGLFDGQPFFRTSNYIGTVHTFDNVGGCPPPFSTWLAAARASFPPSCQQ